MKLKWKIGGWEWGRLKLLTDPPHGGQDTQWRPPRQHRKLGRNLDEFWSDLLPKCAEIKGCLSPRIRIRPVSPPASYYPSFRRLYIQVNVWSTQYLAVQRSALIVDQNTYLFQNRGTEWLYHTAHWSVRGQTTDHAGDWLKTVVHCVHVTVSQAPFANTVSQTHENSGREHIDMTVSYPWLQRE